MRKPPTCDIPHCGGRRMRWQRLCARCYRALPGELRVGIGEAHHQRRWRDWHAMRQRAAEALGLKRYAPTLSTEHVTAERAYDLTARLLGERS